MDFIDVWAGQESPDKCGVAKKLGVKLAPGDFSLLVSNDKKRVREKRQTTDFVAGKPGSKQEMNSLLTDTRYDFMVVDFPVGKRNVRMAKRYETAIAVPVARAFSLRSSDIASVRRNLLAVQEIGGTLLICSGARDASQIRSGRDLAAIGILMGIKPDLAVKAVKQVPNAMVERNRKRAKQEAWGVEP